MRRQDLIGRGCLKAALLSICLMGILCGCGKTAQTNQKDVQASREAERHQDESQEASEKDAKDVTDVPKEKPEDKIYTYLQGIKSYEKNKEWSGPWCYEEAGGQQFSQFGCGICSLANIYSTLGKRECTPLEMYEWAQAVSSYNPHGGLGAIGWDSIRITLQKSGFTCKVGRKPKKYEDFQKLMKESESMMVLVSSDYDDTYWKDVPGHYVTLWLYDEEEDQVFLADSSGASRNRKWIPLRYAYDALKTSSPQQYVQVTAYDSNEDGWKP